MPACRCAGEGDRSLQHQGEVPGIDVRRSFVACGRIRPTGRTGRELPDRRRVEPVGRRVEESIRKKRWRLVRGSARLCIEDPRGPLVRDEAPHEIVREIESSVVSSGAQKLRVGEAVPGQGERSVDPVERLIGNLGSERRHELKLDAFFR